MKIRFYAHACFRLESGGRSVVTDPYHPGEISGFEPIEEEADYVFLSSKNDVFHNDPSHVNGNPKVVRAFEMGNSQGEVDGLKVRSFLEWERYHWPYLLRGWLPRRYAMYHITFPEEGVRVFHTGDIGRPMKESFLSFLEGQVDIMLAITGGVHNIELDDMDRAIERIRPKVVIPMHYYNPKGKIPDIYPVTTFTERHPADSVVEVGKSDVEIDLGSLPDTTRIYVLEPCR